ncbi:MAG: methionyl-tRNA formyltransferase [Brevinema sp.]
MKIIYWGNSLFSLKPLEVLAQNVTVVAVVTAPDTVVGRGMKTPRLNPIKEFAIQHNIPVLQPAKLKNNTEFIEMLNSFEAVLFVLVSFGKIVPASIFTLPRKGMINLHASLLPSLRGASPIQFALWQGLEETGNTVQYIAAGMDEGDILAQELMPILPEDDYYSLEQRLSSSGANLVLEVVRGLENNAIKALPQNHDMASYCSLITKEDGIVDFSMTAEEILRAYKALKHFPGIALPWKDGMLKIIECVLGDKEGKRGEILNISPDGLELACHEGSIIFKIVQASGKKACSAKDFANGMRLKLGDILS